MPDQYKKHTVLLLASFPSSPFYLPSGVILLPCYYFKHMDMISLSSKLFFLLGRWDLPWVRGSVRLLSRVPAISWNLRWEWNRVGEMEPENKNGVSPMQWHYTKLRGLQHCPVFYPIRTLSKIGWKHEHLHYSLVLSVNLEENESTNVSCPAWDH